MVASDKLYELYLRPHATPTCCLTQYLPGTAKNDTRVLTVSILWKYGIRFELKKGTTLILFVTRLDLKEANNLPDFSSARRAAVLNGIDHRS